MKIPLKNDLYGAKRTQPQAMEQQSSWLSTPGSEFSQPLSVSLCLLPLEKRIESGYKHSSSTPTSAFGTAALEKLDVPTGPSHQYNMALEKNREASLRHLPSSLFPNAPPLCFLCFSARSRLIVYLR